MHWDPLLMFAARGGFCHSVFSLHLFRAPGTHKCFCLRIALLYSLGCLGSVLNKMRNLFLLNECCFSNEKVLSTFEMSFEEWIDKNTFLPPESCVFPSWKIWWWRIWGDTRIFYQSGLKASREMFLHGACFILIMFFHFKEWVERWG